jgi:hypothetical protein
MANPWKLATIGLAVILTTALVTGLTTAYLVRDARTAQIDPVAPPTPAVRATRPTAAPRRPAPATVANPAPAPVVATIPAPPPRVEPPAPPIPPAPSVAAPVPMPRVEPVAAPAPAVSVPADCATGGERALRVAKPGVLGGLIGAGLGAAGGAIADGGKGAGKGAAIGAMAGAVLGTGYGAVKTREECGTVFGGAAASTPAGSPWPRSGTSGERVEPVQAPFAASGPGITIYSAR